MAKKRNLTLLLLVVAWAKAVKIFKNNLMHKWNSEMIKNTFPCTISFWRLFFGLAFFVQGVQKHTCQSNTNCTVKKLSGWKYLLFLPRLEMMANQKILETIGGRNHRQTASVFWRTAQILRTAQNLITSAIRVVGNAGN